jgi:hypothetical protein
MRFSPYYKQNIRNQFIIAQAAVLNKVKPFQKYERIVFFVGTFVHIRAAGGASFRGA